jgi:hypothetical protein
LKDFNESFWDSCITHSKLSTIAPIFIIISDYRLSEVNYNSIIELIKIMLPEKKSLKENYYVAKSMMKSFGLGYQKINKCLNFCMLYYDEYANFTECKPINMLRINPILIEERNLSLQKIEILPNYF